jgi:hypothetical protein
MKGHYGPSSTTIEMAWSQGVFAPISNAVNQRSRDAHETAARETFLDNVRRTIREGRGVSASPGTRNYAPNAFVDLPRSQYVAKEFADAMNQLFEAGKIRLVGYTTPDRKKRERIGPADKQFG